jgi:hypothetical protein
MRLMKKSVWFASLVLVLALVGTGSAQSRNSDCKEAKGTSVDVFNGAPGVAYGTITNAGWLKGTAVTTFAPGGAPTPDPAVFSFRADAELTTEGGQLKYHLVFIFNPLTGIFTSMGRIDPTSSTGRFGGATGTIYLNGGAVDPITFVSEIAGQICLAKP